MESFQLEVKVGGNTGIELRITGTKMHCCGGEVDRHRDGGGVSTQLRAIAASVCKSGEKGRGPRRIQNRQRLGNQLKTVTSQTLPCDISSRHKSVYGM